MKTAVYVRISTKDQDEQIQMDALRRWLQENPGEPVWFIDRGESSEATSRPEWNRCLEELESGAYSTLVVWKMDRIGRWGIDDTLRFRLYMKQRGVQIVSITEGSRELSSAIDYIAELLDQQAREKWLKDHRDRARASWLTHAASYDRAALRKRRCDWGEVMRLRDQGLSHNQIAERMGVRRISVARIIKKMTGQWEPRQRRERAKP